MVAVKVSVADDNVSKRDKNLQIFLGEKPHIRQLRLKSTLNSAKLGIRYLIGIKPFYISKPLF